MQSQSFDAIPLDIAHHLTLSRSCSVSLIIIINGGIVTKYRVTRVHSTAQVVPSSSEQRCRAGTVGNFPRALSSTQTSTFDRQFANALKYPWCGMRHAHSVITFGHRKWCRRQLRRHHQSTEKKRKMKLSSFQSYAPILLPLIGHCH